VIDRAFENGFRLFRLFPLTLNYTLDDWCIGDLLQYLQEKRLPVCIWHSETSWSAINRLCTAYPELPVIIEGSGKKIIYYNRMFYPLLKYHSNLYLESHGLLNLGLIEDIEKFGFANRLLFGTAMPFADPHIAVGLVCYANIQQVHAEEIAGKTLQKILDGVIQ